MAKRGNPTWRKGGPSPNPHGRRGTRNDAWINPQTGHGTASDAGTYTIHRSDPMVDLEGLLLWENDDIMARIVEMKPREAFRRGFTVKISGDDSGVNDTDKETAEVITGECERLDLAEKVKFAAQLERACGGAAIFPVLEGAVGELDEPLGDYEDAITGIAALHVLEPRELVPVEWYDDLADPKFRQPSVYRFSPLSGPTRVNVAPVYIHATRLVIFPGIRVTTQTRPGQRPGWGDSVLKKCRQVVADYGISWSSCAALLRGFAHGVFKLGGLADILKEKDGEEQLDRRVAAMMLRQSTLGAAVIDKDDDYTRINTSLAGVEGLLVQMMNRVAATADVTVTALFGIAAAGLNATGEGDRISWYDRVDGERAYHKDRVSQLVRLIMLASDGPTGGVEPDHWSVEFPPLWQPSEKEVAEVRYIVAQTDQIYANLGSASSDEIAKSRWQGDSYSPEMFIDWEARAKQEKLDAQQAAKDAEALAAMGRQPPPAAGANPADPNAPPVADPSGAAGDPAAPAAPIRVVRG